MNHGCAAMLLGALLAAGGAPAAGRQVLPATFDHHRIILAPAVDGRTIRFYTDTGGGWNALSDTVAGELSLPVKELAGEGETVRLVAFPEFDAGASIPAAPPHFMDGQLMLGDAQRMFDGFEGFLGGRWFADRVWELDYPAQRIALLDSAGEPAGTCVPLGFQEKDGQRTMHFPSIDVSVDGEVLPMLFDTGATVTTTEASAPVLGVQAGQAVAGSFIEHAVFERWRKEHPEWRVVEKADQVGKGPRSMIEVPQVVVAGHAVGPVWFAERPEGSFQQWMASMMDRPVWGALGGSGLQYFRVVVDYPGSRACFEKPL